MHDQARKRIEEIRKHHSGGPFGPCEVCALLAIIDKSQTRTCISCEGEVAEDDVKCGDCQRMNRAVHVTRAERRAQRIATGRDVDRVGRFISLQGFSSGPDLSKRNDLEALLNLDERPAAPPEKLMGTAVLHFLGYLDE